MAPLEETSVWAELLVPSERERAEEIASDMLRARFVVSRGLRRKVLAECVGRAAEELVFEEDGEGKPRLVDGDGWDFNLSHAGDYVAVAVARGAVGIDLEMRREVREMNALVRRYFHRDEVTAWENLEEEERVGGFFLLWSAREAAMKCCGLGLAKGLSVTRVDPVFLQDGMATAVVGGMEVKLERIEAPAGYVMVVGRGGEEVTSDV